MIQVTTLSEAGGHVNNQDAFEVRPFSQSEDCFLCAVADGQGGRTGGGEAARLACRACLDTASTYPLTRLLRPESWVDLLHATDAAVSDDPVAGFTTLVAFCITPDLVCGASNGDSEAILLQPAGVSNILTGRQFKNPPLGSGAAACVGFCASLHASWSLLTMSDGVWKYAGLAEVVRIASEKRGPDIITTVRERATLPGSGRLQDDFTLVLFERGG